jgi:NIPSNAP.
MRTLVAFGAAAVIFAAGYWLGSERTAQAAATQVYELRTYTTYDGKLDALNARFRNHTTRLFEKHGMKNVGYWVPVEGPQSKKTLIYVLAHKDMESAKRSWEAFRTDPEWVKVKDESEKNGKIVEKVDSVYMRPTDYSKLR